MYLSMFVFLRRVTSWPYFHTSNAAQSLFYPYSAGLLSWGHYKSFYNFFNWWGARDVSLFSSLSWILACLILWGFIITLQISSSVWISATSRCESSSIQLPYILSERSTGFSGKRVHHVFESTVTKTISNCLRTYFISRSFC